MSFYVRRVHTGTGRVGWVGPIRSERQAWREYEAWESAIDSFGDSPWSADVFRSCDEVKRQVREWQRERSGQR